MQMTNTYDVEAVLHDVENIVGKGDDALSLFPMKTLLEKEMMHYLFFL